MVLVLYGTSTPYGMDWRVLLRQPLHAAIMDSEKKIPEQRIIEYLEVGYKRLNSNSVRPHQFWKNLQCMMVVERNVSL
jgi:hypothetical protein